MALTNAQRVKRWRERHRVLFNYRRRNARALKAAGVSMDPQEDYRRRTTAEKEPVVYRDEFGRIVSEEQFLLMNLAKTP